MKDNNCPECNALTNAATELNGNRKPSEGDVSVCMYCGAINQFDADLTIIPMPDSVLADIKEYEPETHSMLMDAVIYIKANNKR